MTEAVVEATIPDGIHHLEGQLLRLDGRLGTASYDRQGERLLAEGLYVDLPAWGYHVFEMMFIPVPESAADNQRSANDSP